MSDKTDIKEENKKTCFVIMPISDVEGYEKGHFNRVYEYIIKPACRNAGFEPVRADDTSKANVIIVDILQQVLKADMAICDISARNANVFYELGFRQAFNKKTVLIKDNKTVMPFDISSIRTLSYNSSLRIDEVNNSVQEIQKALEETEKANPKDVNSLLKLLSIEKAEMLDSDEVSPETAMILNAINELRYRGNNGIDSNIDIDLLKGDKILFLDGGERKLGKVIEASNHDVDTVIVIAENGCTKIVNKKDIIL